MSYDLFTYGVVICALTIVTTLSFIVLMGSDDEDK
jgi:hypothetical protein